MPRKKELTTPEAKTLHTDIENWLWENYGDDADVINSKALAEALAKQGYKK